MARIALIALFAVSAIILGMIVPGVVQQFQVSPNVPDKEGPYLARNIEATRAAYGLDQIDEQQFAGAAMTGNVDGRLDVRVGGDVGGFAAGGAADDHRVRHPLVRRGDGCVGGDVADLWG